MYLLCCLVITFNQSSIGLCHLPFLRHQPAFSLCVCVSFSHLKRFTLVFFFFFVLQHAEKLKNKYV